MEGKTPEGAGAGGLRRRREAAGRELHTRPFRAFRQGGVAWFASVPMPGSNAALARARGGGRGDHASGKGELRCSIASSRRTSPAANGLPASPRNNRGLVWRWRIENGGRLRLPEPQRILSGFDLSEECKWGKPCYTMDGKNIVIIQGFKEYYALGFFQGALLKDPEAPGAARPGSGSRE